MENQRVKPEAGFARKTSEVPVLQEIREQIEKTVETMADRVEEIHSCLDRLAGSEVTREPKDETDLHTAGSLLTDLAGVLKRAQYVADCLNAATVRFEQVI